MKISVIYFSETGGTGRVAEFIAGGARAAGDTEVRLFNLKSGVDADFVNDCAAVIFGTPTYCAGMCWQMKKWFDTDQGVRLGGKLGAVFATENSPNGDGAEAAILSVVTHLLVKGMLVYSSGTEFGRPFIHIGPAVVRKNIPEKEERRGPFERRMARKARAASGAFFR